ncbi:hypothetical protein [Deinococcus sonorensis]|uniref:ParB/Sulfiredoxin domain-containing protein n=1 Tax=Deinococcus sonorensis TaxID=309891 RepID=A0ABV8YBS8_9DEIO
MTQQPGLFTVTLDTTVHHIDVTRIQRPTSGRLLPGVRTLGQVLSPVSLRPSTAPDYDFEVVYGEARVNSAYEYGLSTVPAYLLAPHPQCPQDDATREAALQVMENSRSANYVVEARAVGRLLASGYDVATIEDQLGMDSEAVKLRARLWTLGEPVLTVTGAGGTVPVSVALRIANLPQDLRDAACQQVVELHQAGQLARAQDPATFRKKDFMYSSKRLQRLTAKRAEKSQAALDTVFGSAAPLLVDTSALDQLEQQVRTLASLRGVTVGDLIARLQAGEAAPAPAPAALPVTPLPATPVPVPPPAPPAVTRHQLSGTTRPRHPLQGGRA